MARAIWSGVMSFGLVSVPIELYTATEAHERTFHQFEQGTKDRIRYQRVNERTGKEVDYSDIVKGAEVGRGKYVMLDQDELDSVAPGRSRSLDIHTFVDLDDIDPIHFDKTYFLGPRGDENKKTYALLRDAMADTNRAAIATFVMRSKEYLVAVRADGDLLVLETLFFADEIRKPKDEIGNIPAGVKLRPQELKMARQLIESMSGPWRPGDYRDSYTDRVEELIKAKRKGTDVRVADDAPEATGSTDLMEALKASLQDGRRGKRSAATKSKKSTATKSTATKSTATKSTAKRSTATKSKKSTAKKSTATKSKKSTATKSKKSTARKGQRRAA